MRRGEPGYVATLQVRMLHAHSRRLARDRGYDEAAYGAPINQVDLVRTWLDFTVTSYRAEGIMGFEYHSHEQESLYRYWWYVAHVLGIDPRLVEGISNNDQAQRVDDLLAAVTGAPIAESGRLAELTLRSIAGMIQEALPIPENAGMPALYALTRRFHGDVACDELGLPRAPAADNVLSLAVNTLHHRRVRLRRDPAAWQKQQQQNLDEAQAQRGPDTEATGYERAAH
jgi:hypothetical protein